MKFMFVKKVSGPVPTYGGNVVETGDVVELDGHLAQKAVASPDYETIDENARFSEPKRRGRPPKINESINS